MFFYVFWINAEKSQISETAQFSADYLWGLNSGNKSQIWSNGNLWLAPNTKIRAKNDSIQHHGSSSSPWIIRHFDYQVSMLGSGRSWKLLLCIFYISHAAGLT